TEHETLAYAVWRKDVLPPSLRDLYVAFRMFAAPPSLFRGRETRRTPVSRLPPSDPWPPLSSSLPRSSVLPSARVQCFTSESVEPPSSEPPADVWYEYITNRPTNILATAQTGPRPA